MLDLKWIREYPEDAKKMLEFRGDSPDSVDELLNADKEYRQLLKKVEENRAEKNRVSKEIASLKKERKDATGLIKEMKTLSDDTKKIDEKINDLKNHINFILYRLPNKPHETVPFGKNDEENKVVFEWKEKTKLDFIPLPHWEIGETLDILDIQRGSKISGSGFILYKNLGAKLERALINWMIDIHTAENGFTEIFSPFLVNGDSMFGTGQLPKFADDMYYVEKDDLYLIPTAEVPVTNIHRNEVLKAEELPKSYVSYTPCFRREAGSYGKDTRGLMRVHQFNKVEMVKIVKPENSYDVLEELTNYAENILQRLELHYNKAILCSGDLGFGAAKCYDLNVYSPGVDQYLEISSISNYEDFQARRLNLRYKPTPNSKPEFVHTLNGSGLALARLVIAIIENYQTEDCMIKIPDALKPYMNNLDYIK